MIIKNLKILLLISFGSLVLASGMYFDEQSSESELPSESLIPTFESILQEIAYIEFSNSQGKSVIEDIEGQWLITTSYNFPANTELLSRFFIQLREAKILEAKTNRTDLLYKLGLDDDNKMRLILKSSDGRVLYDLDIGTYNYNIPGSYIKNTQESQSYLVNTNLTADVSGFYWTPTDLLNIGKSQIQTVQIYNQNMINLEEKDSSLRHSNLPLGFSKLSEDKISGVHSALTDLQHNGFILRSNLPNSSDLKVRYTLKNGTVLFVELYDIKDRGIHATFDWNYINDDIQITKFIDPILDGGQLQVSSVSLLSDFAYSVPQVFFDNNNLKLRAKSE